MKLIVFIALAFGYWFATNQAVMISPDALSLLPTKYFSLTVLKCVLTIITVYLFSHLLLSCIAKIKPIYTALTFMPILLIYFNQPLLHIVALISIFQIFLLLLILKKQDYQQLKKAYLVDIIVLSILFLLHLIFTTQYSPTHWDMALLSGRLVSEEIPVVSPLFKGYALAKQFVFSSIDYSEWAGIMHPPITLHSPFLQLLTLIYDLPSISPETFHAVISAIYFLLIVTGSFGFYLLLKYAANISTAFAFFGGCIFFFGGSPHVASMMAIDAGVFLSSYCVYPYALLFIYLALKNESYKYGFWASIALASQFFWMAPHPEATIYSFGFFTLFAFGILNKPSERKKIAIILTSLFVAILLSAFAIFPIVYDQLIGEAHTFAHTGDIMANSFKTFVSASLILAFCFMIKDKVMDCFELRFRNDEAFFQSSLYLSLFMLFFILLSCNVQIMTFLIHGLHINLHMWCPWRIGMYYSLSVSCLLMICLDRLTHKGILWFDKRYPGLICI